MLSNFCGAARCLMFDDGRMGLCVFMNSNDLLAFHLFGWENVLLWGFLWVPGMNYEGFKRMCLKESINVLFVFIYTLTESFMCQLFDNLSLTFSCFCILTFSSFIKFVNCICVFVPRLFCIRFDLLFHYSHSLIYCHF